MNLRKTQNLNPTPISYAGLILVVFIWGLAPVLTQYFFKYYSASLYGALRSFIALIALLIISGKKLKLIDKTYLKVAIPTGLFYSLACVMQKIGLQYTTPTKYAFLENLSCVIVPFLMYFLIKKKPTFLKILSAIICLASCFILSGMMTSGIGSFGIGEILCGLAGIFYGVNIAGSGAYAKKVDASVYLTIQMFIEFVISTITTILLNFVSLNKVSVLEPIKFSFEFLPILYIILSAMIICVLCWIIRMKCMRHVNASAVAIIMPFSAVITSVISVIVGSDILSLELIVGAILGLIAIFISSYDDIKESKEEATQNKKQLE